jgi:hypothetical protein
LSIVPYPLAIAHHSLFFLTSLSNLYNTFRKLLLPVLPRAMVL